MGSLDIAGPLAPSNGDSLPFLELLHNINLNEANPTIHIAEIDLSLGALALSDFVSI